VGNRSPFERVKQMEQLQRDIIHESMMRDFHKVIEKHFPNFYVDNIEESTRAFLTLFTEETIHQLGKETN
jgi:hypothetical protein